MQGFVWQTSVFTNTGTPPAICGVASKTACELSKLKFFTFFLFNFNFIVTFLIKCDSRSKKKLSKRGQASKILIEYFSSKQNDYLTVKECKKKSAYLRSLK
tara:strand:- start:876 stop:1178 length:303 start_codon:yes stop_codon:yes gene_type:complete